MSWGEVDRFLVENAPDDDPARALITRFDGPDGEQLAVALPATVQARALISPTDAITLGADLLQLGRTIEGMELPR